MSNAHDDEKNLGQVGEAVLYKYGWLCMAEWVDYEQRTVNWRSFTSSGALNWRECAWQSMQQYLFF